MVFSSLQFLFLFLPFSIVCYYMVRTKSRNLVLLLVSLIFYSCGEPTFVFVLILLCLFNWWLGHMIHQNHANKSINRVILGIGITIDLSVLIVYKYMNFITYNICRIYSIRVTQIALPIGISFFTFQILSYLIDVYRKPNENYCENPIHLALYISFFPQLIAGPIVRYNSIIMQIKNRKENLVFIGEGIERFILGLTKKVFLANTISELTDKAFTNSSELSLGFAWLGALAYTFQIYFDFSGYSDMAIGLAKMFGFTLNENFSYPYCASSITDFWRRWHISLSEWFRDYVYLPLGGDGRSSKHKRLVETRNLFLVWLLTGIWHGAQWTFIIWGLGYFFLLIMEKRLVLPEKRSRVFRRFYRFFSLVMIMLLWVVFRANSIEVMISYFKSMFMNNRYIDNQFIFYAVEFRFFFVLAVFMSTPLFKMIIDKLGLVKNKVVKNAFDVGKAIMVIMLFVMDLSYLIMGYHNPFIYFNF